MAYDAQTAKRVRQILGARPGVEERQLMGGLAFLVEGAMCCSVGLDSLLVRVGAEGREQALARPHVKPMKLGRRVMTGFVRIEPGGFKTDAALEKWIERGIEAGKASKRSRGRRTVVAQRA